MSILRLPHPSRPAKPVPPHLGQQIDDLFELRALLRRSQASERALTTQILQALTAARLTEFQGEQATAIIDLRLEERS
jgi:hypothetical protein